MTDPYWGSESLGPALARIYLARHGRTPLNAAGALRGHLDPDLDSVGQLEASLLGDVLSGENLERITSSPLKRAVATASEVARRAGLEVKIDPRFIDRDYGSWAGRTKDEIIAQWGSLDDVPEIESERAVLARSMVALKDASRQVGRGAVLVVSHDAVNRLLLTSLDPHLGSAETVPQDTGCFNVLQRKGEEWAVLSVNNIPRSH